MRHPSLLNIAFLISAIAFLQAESAMSQVDSDSRTATLTVEGRVLDVFRSVSDENMFAVQILVRRSNAIWTEQSAPPVDFPGPGDCLYAHVEAARGTPKLPRPNMEIRATLNPGRKPQWNASNKDWFEEIRATSDSVAADSEDKSLGVRVTSVALRLRRALKVTDVEPNSPGANAGLEVGDILVEADGVALKRPEQWSQVVQRGDGNMKLLVRDVRSGRDVPVKLSWQDGSSETRRPPRSLGVETELAFFQGSPVLKVKRVEDGSPAKRSGISPGWLILSANGKSVDKPEKLTQAVADANNSIDLEA